MQFQQLGPYRLGRKLGQGGMGAVYEALDTDTQQSAAVKVLAPALAAEEGFRVRFEAEIESLKKLRHPNIVRLYGYGEQEGTLFYAMELVRGTSLEDELRGGRRFDWRETTQLAIKLCRALKHAHDHGVIHRDIKPANLLLTAEGEIKLSDFGIARLFGNTRMTSDGGVLGTAEYMAPEQADGRMVTDRCDQYSLGGVMYALLAGRPPFRAKSLVEMLQLQRYSEPDPVTRYAPQTPAELARIVHQLLAKDPQDRFANTLILARSLEAMERGLSISLSQSGHDDFVLSNPPEGTHPALSGANPAMSGYSPAAPTLSPTQLGAGLAASVPPDNLEATAATMAYEVEPREASPRSDPPAEIRETKTTRFTKVEEKRESRETVWTELAEVLFTPQAIALALALAAVVGLGWYVLRTPSADEMYSQIEAATAEGDLESLRAAEPQIQRFLGAYPQDARAEDLQAMLDESKQANPIQRLYAEAMRTSVASPEAGAAKLQSLIDVYDEGDAGPDTTRHYVKLARVQLKKLQKRIDGYTADGLKLLTARLDEAARIAKQQPAEAEKIYRGVIDLYADKPWAAEQVARASAALAALSSASSNSK